MIKVMKFGGTSVATESARNRIVDRVKQELQNGFQPVLVVSAIGRNGDPYATDTLIHLVKTPEVELNKRDLDLLMSCGETISAVVVSSLLNERGIKATAVTGFQAGIATDSHFGNADVLAVQPERLFSLIEAGVIPVVTGFQGISPEGEITTLGRGGSDTTATLLGVALDAAEVEIYTDVDGVMTADPRVVTDATVINNLAFSEIYQMAIDGAKVVDHKAISIAMKSNKPLRIKNTFNDTEGTLISENLDHEVVDYVPGQFTFTAFTHKHQLVQVTLDTVGISSDVNEQMLEDFEKYEISMDMISFFTEKKIFIINDEKVAVLENVLQKLHIPYKLEKNLSKITAVSHRMHGVPGIMKRIVLTLTRANIGILQTSDSNTTISCLVHTEEANLALNTLHKQFKVEN